jgi:hypothetical protein
MTLSGLHGRTRWGSTLLAGLGAAIALAGCGSSSAHKPPPAAKAAKAAHAGKLPQRAHVVFASDQGLATGTVVSAHITGKVVASDGFVPTRDGFSFENYGFIAGQELDPHAMRELFGDVVCATTPSDSCTLTPAAAQWAEQVAEAMVGGHCFGFSMTALRFFTHNLKASQFGGSTPYSLTLTPALQSEIAYGWASQVIPAVERQGLVGQPSAIVAFLEKALNNRSGPVYTLGLYSAPESDSSREGHAVTPTGIADLGNDKYAILLYDNNKPGTTQAMYVDAKAETWSYQVATTPSQPNGTWSGQGTSNELDLVPLSAILHKQQCPFCSSASGTTGVDTISLGGNPVAHAHLLITAADGRRLGYVGGRFVDQIKGARVIRPELNEIWKAFPEPIYQVPAGDKVTVTLQGGDPTGTDAAQVHVSGPGFGATVARLMPTPTSDAEITITPGGAKLSLRLLGHLPSQPPQLQLARDQGRKGNEVAVTPSDLKAGNQLSVGLQPTSHQVSVTSSGATMPVSVTLHSVGPQGTKTVRKQNIGVTAGQQTTLNLGLIRVG